jgi:uncharacterized membrane protein YidH (DUF202 family)
MTLFAASLDQSQSWSKSKSDYFPILGMTDISLSNRSSLLRPWKLFLSTPWNAPLLIPNQSSDVRDHLANERTFLSWLRLSIYLAVVSIAILINFHLKHRPSKLEEKVSLPLGMVFWFLALASLVSGFANYVRTVAKYARRDALVQSGIKTQVIFGIVSGAIIVACVLFLGIEAARGVGM